MSTETKTYVTAVKQKYKYDIMISYCDADKDIVHKIQQFLIHQGYNIWLDSDQNYEYGKSININCYIFLKNIFAFLQ